MMAVDISPARLGTPWPRSMSSRSLSSLALLSKPPQPQKQPASNKKTSFVDLPYEIRSMIYAHYLPRRPSSSTKVTQTIDRLAKDLAKGYLHRGRAGKWARLDNNPYHSVRNLLVVSRQIYHEVLGEVLNRFRISVPNIFELKRGGRPAQELEAVFTDLVGKRQMIRHLEIDVMPKKHVTGVPTTTMTTMTTTTRCAGTITEVARHSNQSQSQSQNQDDLSFSSIDELELNKDVWDCLLPGLKSVKINVSPARLPPSEEWAFKMILLAILRYVDARVTDLCVVEVHAATKEDRKLIASAIRHPRLVVVVQAEEEEEWWEMNGSAD